MEGIRNLTFPKDIFSGFNLPQITKPAYALASGGSVPERSMRNETDADANKSITIVNVTDPRDLDLYLASSDGQDSILNVLSSRSDTVKRMLR